MTTGWRGSRAIGTVLWWPQVGGEAELLVQFYDDHRLEGKQSYWYSSMMTTGWRGSRAIGTVLYMTTWWPQVGGKAELLVQFYDDLHSEGKAELLVQLYDEHRVEGKQSYWYSSMMTTQWRESRAIGTALWWPQIGGEAELLVQFYDEHRLEGKQSY